MKVVSSNPITLCVYVQLGMPAPKPHCENLLDPTTTKPGQETDMAPRATPFPTEKPRTVRGVVSVFFGRFEAGIEKTKGCNVGESLKHHGEVDKEMMLLLFEFTWTRVMQNIGVRNIAVRQVDCWFYGCKSAPSNIPNMFVQVQAAIKSNSKLGILGNLYLGTCKFQHYAQLSRGQGDAFAHFSVDKNSQLRSYPPFLPRCA